MNRTDVRKKERYERDLERLRRLRPIDDTMMRALFHDNVPLVQLVLRIIIGKSDLVVLNCSTQADMKRVTGAKSICLDAYATDSEGKMYDLEIQRAESGADPHRARYHSGVMAVENLNAGQDFSELPDTYTIFITEKDFFGYGLPVYHIQNQIEEINKPFQDGAFILYVNGEYRGNSEIGRLMHDFGCTDAKDMHYSLLASRTQYLKETEKGVSSMCKIMEEAMEERAFERAVEIAEKLLQTGRMTHEEIAATTSLPLAKIKELAEQKSA